MQEAVAFTDAGALVAVQADRVYLVDERDCTATMSRVTQFTQRTYCTYRPPHKPVTLKP